MKYEGPHANLLKIVPELIQERIFFRKSPLFDESLIPFLQKPVEQLQEMLSPITKASDDTKQQVWICIAVQNPKASAKDLIQIAEQIQLSPKDIMECAIAIGKLAVVEGLDPALLNQNHFIDAAFYGHLDVVEFFAKKYKLIDLDKASNYYALRQAVKQEHLAIVKYFVKNATPDILPMMTKEILNTGITSQYLSMVAFCIEETFTPLYWLTEIKKDNYALVRKSVIWDPSITYYFLDFLTKHDSESLPTIIPLVFSTCARKNVAKAVIELMEHLAKKMSLSLLENTIKEEFNFFRKESERLAEAVIIYLAEKAFIIAPTFFKELLASDNYGIITKIARDDRVEALKYFHEKAPALFPEIISANQYKVMQLAGSCAFVFLAKLVPSKDLADLIEMTFLKTVKDERKPRGEKKRIVEWCVTAADTLDSARSVLKKQLPDAFFHLSGSNKNDFRELLRFLSHESPNFVKESHQSFLEDPRRPLRYASLRTAPFIVKQNLEPENKEPEKEKKPANNPQNPAKANYLGIRLFKAASPESQRKTASSGLHF